MFVNNYLLNYIKMFMYSRYNAEAGKQSTICLQKMGTELALISRNLLALTGTCLH